MITMKKYSIIQEKLNQNGTELISAKVIKQTDKIEIVYKYFKNYGYHNVSNFNTIIKDNDLNTKVNTKNLKGFYKNIEEFEKDLRLNLRIKIK